ncbi:MAG: PfkB family carbohydrate kinase [Thermomicrobiales bacterium]
MTSFDVVGLGFSSLDTVGLVPQLPQLDEGAPLLGITRQGGGPVAQALVTLQRLGAATGYVGSLGDDEAGQAMVAGLRAEGVDTSRLIITPGRTSPQCIILVHAPTGLRSICCEGGTAPPVPSEGLDLDYLCSGLFLHLDGIAGEAALVTAKEAKRRDVRVCLDAGGPSDALFALVPHVDVLIASERFVAGTAGSPGIADGAAQLLTQGPSIVVVTSGKQGSWTASTSGAFATPAFDVPVVDTTGAGDVFHGAFLYGLVQGWDLPVVTRFAAATAALKCRKLGGRAGIPSLPDVLAFLAEQGETSPGGC